MSNLELELIGKQAFEIHRLESEVADLIQIAKDFDEALGELSLHCNCGQADCRTTRLRAAIAKATGSSA